MRLFLWHVHGSWTTTFVQGAHEYVVPVLPDRGPNGRGRAQTWEWPARVRELPPERLHSESLDLVVLQRPHELELTERWTGCRPGRDLPAVYLEHNTPGGQVPYTRHPMADQTDIPVVHVTHFNRLMWDTGDAPTYVVEHGVVDPGYRYLGDLPRAAVVVKDPLRRGRAVGTDLLPAVADAAPVDVFGMGTEGMGAALGTHPDRLATFDLPQHLLHEQLAQRRVYVHTARWTSLGLSLIEAMHLGMPVVALGATEIPRAVPYGTGIVTTQVDELVEAVWGLVHNPALARAYGASAREHALEHYGLARFLEAWDTLLARFALS